MNASLFTLYPAGAPGSTNKINIGVSGPAKYEKTVFLLVSLYQLCFGDLYVFAYSILMIRQTE